MARVKQTWGIGHVTDVLTGRATDKVVAARHDSCRRSACCKEESAAAVRGYIEQLVADGLLLRDGEPYPVLRLTPAGASLLKGEGACALYREVAAAEAKKSARGRRPRRGGVRAPIRSCSMCCARCGCGWRASAACRRT